MTIPKIPIIGIIMGSVSDWKIMRHAVVVLKKFNVAYETQIISAHRTPDQLFVYAEQAKARGLHAIIAGAGGAAHLAGMIAAKTIIPVFGVPVPSKYLRGEDSLLSIVQMPKGIPVATYAIGEAGATNAALSVIAILAITDKGLAIKLEEFRDNQTKLALKAKLPL